jgi:hypothetical protein
VLREVVFRSHLEAFNAQLSKTMKELCEIPADGNCLFSAIAAGIANDKTQHMLFRQKACDFLQDHREDFENRIDWNGPYEEYIRKMRESGTFGGEPELIALASCEQVIIRIHRLGSDPYEIDLGNTLDKKVIELAHHIVEHHPPHYNLVIDRRLL